MMMKRCAGILMLVVGAVAFAPPSTPKLVSMKLTTNRRNVLLASSLFGGFFGGSQNPASAKPTVLGAKGPTNEIGKVANSGMKLRRLGGSDILVSELGLGTQRWASTDFNAPDADTCFKFMVRNCTSEGCDRLIRVIPKTYTKQCSLCLSYIGQGNPGVRGKLD
jgi:hypothetical protein